jgi:hypothetical protein
MSVSGTAAAATALVTAALTRCALTFLRSGSSPDPGSVYKAFGGGTENAGPQRSMLVLSLVLVVMLQLALLSYVAVAWSEKFNATLSYNLATYPIIGDSVQLPDWAKGMANHWFMLILAKVGSLCALALYTHAEAQAAVDLFEDLRHARKQQPAQLATTACTRSQHGSKNWQQSDAPPSVWTLIVPMLQLIMALATLFVQGIIYQSYTVRAAADADKRSSAMEAVYSCVGLVFILDIDNQAWKLVQPLLQDANSHADGDSLNLLTAAGNWMADAGQWLADCCSVCILCKLCKRLWQCISSAVCYCCSCCSGECVLVYAFHVLLFVYECTFGMLLTLYATDHALILRVDNPGQLAAAIVLGFFCFVTVQTVAGVRTLPARIQASKHTGCFTPCGSKWWRPLVLNLLAPLVAGGYARVMYHAFNKETASSAWRCHAGAVIGCTNCDVNSTWCVSTVSCKDSCLQLPVGATAGSSCLSNWCNNRACLECLLKTNAAVPAVDVNTAMKPQDCMPMCGKMSNFMGCMHLWFTAVPLLSMVLVAAVFLFIEGSCCSSCCCCDCRHADREEQHEGVQSPLSGLRQMQPLQRLSASDVESGGFVADVGSSPYGAVGVLCSHSASKVSTKLVSRPGEIEEAEP